MSWHAVDTLGDSYEETKEFLLPFDLRRWLKVTVLVFFAGGASGSFPTSFGNTSGMGTTNERTVEEVTGEIPRVTSADVASVTSELLTPAVVAVLLVILALVLAFAYLSAVFTFVFYHSMMNREVAILSGVAEYAVDGFKYFVFNLVMLFFWVASFGVAIAAFFGFGPVGLGFVPVLIPFWVLLWLVSFYVRMLALPEMVVGDAGFVEGLRKGYGYVRGEPKQAAVFLITSIVVGIVAAVLFSVAVFGAVILAGIPLIIVGVILYFLNPLLVLLPVAVGIVALLVLWAAVSVPVGTYVYTWVLNVHGRFGE